MAIAFLKRGSSMRHSKSLEEVSMELTSARRLVMDGVPHKEDLRPYLDWIDQTPATHSVRGMYVVGLLQATEAMGFIPARDDRIPAFKDYPLREYMEMLLDCALSFYPELSVAQGLRKLGGLAVPTFAKSIAGGVVMATIGRSWDVALTCIARAYELSLRPGKCVVSESGSGRALVQLRNVWNFGDSYQMGVLDGVMLWCNLEGTITATRRSLCDADLTIEWPVARDGLKPPRRHEEPRPGRPGGAGLR